MYSKIKIGGSFLAFGFSLALLPAVYSVGPWLETRLAPVVSHAEVSSVRDTRRGKAFFVSFRKKRQCEFISLVWYQGNVRLSVDFEPDARDAPLSRPVGEQFVGPWHVQGLYDLSDSRAFAYHRCHPFWTTITHFYAGEGAQTEERADAG